VTNRAVERGANEERSCVFRLFAIVRENKQNQTEQLAALRSAVFLLE
jgi:hypothetical protein